MQMAFPTLEFSSTNVDAVALLGSAGREERGGVYTKREVVEFILDLVGYTSDQDLSQCRILEPSCGAGDFLSVIVKRLLESARKHGVAIAELGACLRAVDVGTAAIAEAQSMVETILLEEGVTAKVSKILLDQWFTHADFLMLEQPHRYTHIVGNPPYVRQEDLPKELLSLYRNCYATMYDRADLYVPFFERCLGLLADDAKLGFICSDRWMKNKYGGPLRKLVSTAYHLDCYIDMTGCPAFDQEVVAYPAVTVISRRHAHHTRACYRPKIDAETLTSMVPALREGASHPSVVEASDVVTGNEPWLLDDFQRLSVIRKIESKYSPLEQVGCKVSIGVATGADRVYISKELDVEPEAKLPLMTTRDIRNGEMNWQGSFVLNPFHEDGSLLELEQFPKFSAYIAEHEEIIRNRNVAKKNPNKWYRTIDRIYPSLLKKEKLLIPDIKGDANVVYDEGHYYPHHNLYYIVSEDWDLRALQAVLLSHVAQAFIATYSLRMRGDCLRYQAQYLRRIRLPQWSEVSSDLRQRLKRAATERDLAECDKLSQELYGLDDKECCALMNKS